MLNLQLSEFQLILVAQVLFTPADYTCFFTCLCSLLCSRSWIDPTPHSDINISGASVNSFTHPKFNIQQVRRATTDESLLSCRLRSSGDYGLVAGLRLCCLCALRARGRHHLPKRGAHASFDLPSFQFANTSQKKVLIYSSLMALDVREFYTLLSVQEL